ncbi:MAG: Methyltransferase type 11 [Pseudonocardiales bacterium]|nr:Methyltransferase type 11 [Pseudonocardiales bacterium]
MSAIESAAMEAEFDTVARWTERVVHELGSEYAIPAACRGSGSPGALRWLGEALELSPTTRLLDDGAGIGGPAAFIAQEFGVRPTLIEPMIGACAAAVRLFGLPVVAAAGERVPFPDATFDAALSLGVLCTTTRKQLLIDELHRVLRAGGGLGMLAFVKTTDDIEQPDGNDFPTEESLHELLDGGGFSVVAEVGAAAFAKAPPDWDRKVAAVERSLTDRHSTDARWLLAEQQQQVIGALLGEGKVVGTLIHARRR